MYSSFIKPNVVINSKIKILVFKFVNIFKNYINKKKYKLLKNKDEHIENFNIENKLEKNEDEEDEDDEVEQDEDRKLFKYKNYENKIFFNYKTKCVYYQ